MRISVDETDAGYDPRWHHPDGDVKIFCDGGEIEHVVTADTEAGYVKFWDKLPSKGGKTTEMHGKVEIRGLD